MEDNIGRDFHDNTHRILFQLISLRAWFTQVEGSTKRLTFHADVSFDEERLGGGPETRVTFKLSVKRCEIVFIPPAAQSFVVDPASVSTPAPLKPIAVRQTEQLKMRKGWGVTLGLSKKSVDGSANLEAGGSRERNTDITSEQTLGAFDEIWKRSREGHEAWSLNGDRLEDGRLRGTIWGGRDQPRLAVVDRRSEGARDLDSKNNMPPQARLEVRCKSEDLDIYDIEFKDPAESERFLTRGHKANKLLAAKQFLRKAIFERGLTAGDIEHDKHADMTIADATVAIIDFSALDS